MKIWYELDHDEHGTLQARIKKVKVLKETAYYVTIEKTYFGEVREHKVAKIGTDKSYFLTYDLACQYLINEMNYKLEDIQKQLKWQQQQYKQITQEYLNGTVI